MESFSIAPAASRGFWILPIAVGLILGLVVVLLGRSLVASRSARFEVSAAALQLRGDWYGRTIPLEHLRLDEARRVDLAVDSALSPQRRTMGTGLPGYYAGWFRLRNGERALLYLTDRSRAVYIPTTRDYSLLLSPAEPERFLSALHAARR